jgi:hypothetical protein
MGDRLSGKYGSTDSGILFNFIGVAGNVKLTDPEGNTDTFALPAGVIPIRAARIWLTGTTATGLVGVK